MKKVNLATKKTYRQSHKPTRKDLIFAPPAFFVFLPPLNWHIWFCPTHKPTLHKTKRANFSTPKLHTCKF